MLLLEDGTSSVAGFEDAGKDRKKKWRERGVTITETTLAFDRL